MYFPGLPAPVVTTGTPSSMMIRAISSQQGFISIKLTPKGLLVFSRQIRICVRSCSESRMVQFSPYCESKTAGRPTPLRRSAFQALCASR